MPELALDDDQRHPLGGHLHSVGVAQLMGRQPAAHPGAGAGATQLAADGRGRPGAAAAGAMQNAEQRSDWQLAAVLKPRLALAPAPAVHAHLAARAALPVPDQHPPARVGSRSVSASASASPIRSPARHGTLIMPRSRSP